jgi:transmembrane sensor
MENKMSYELLIKYFAGNCSEQEKDWVEQWRSSTRENRNAFEYYQATWRNAGDKKTIVPDTEAALNKVNLKLGFTNSDSKAGKTIVITIASYALRVAAMITIIIGGYFLYHTFRPAAIEVQWAETCTQLYEKTEAVLSDGSYVWLNGSSRLRYPKEFSKKERRVILEGEAFFEVSKNPEKPFIIETKKSVTTVLGTQFNVRARKDEDNVVVTVAEGKVAFADKTRPATSQAKLVAGEKGILSAKSGSLVVESNSDPNFMAWKTGMITFKNTPLREVCQTLSEVYGKAIEVKSINKSEITFTSTFEKQKFEDVLKIMELSLHVKIDSMNGKIIILPKE